MNPLLGELSTCRCCDGLTAETPSHVWNRPGLSALAYRVGTHSRFKETMLAALSAAARLPLHKLRTRDNDDFSIALVDAMAMMADVLAFYQERVANESYIRTATERRSLLELARLIGYELRPGVAASTYLAFTLEDSPDAPRQTAIGIGTKVQSIPGPGEQPQTFETSEKIEARPEWNTILPQLTEQQILTWNITELWLEGANLTLAIGDVLLVIAAAGAGFQASLRRVTDVRSDAGVNRTVVRLENISTAPKTVTANKPGVWVMRTVASPFGHNAPKQPQYDKGVFTGVDEWNLDWPSENLIALSARYEKILVNSWVVIEQQDPVAKVFARLWTFAKADRVTHLSLAKYGIAGSVTLLNLSEPWEKGKDPDLSLFRSMTIAAQSEELIVARRPLIYPVYGTALALNSRVEGPIEGRPIAVTGKRQRLRITERAIAPVLNLDAGGSVTLTPGNILSFAERPEKILNGIVKALTPTEFDATLKENPPPLLRLHLIDRDGQSGIANLNADAIHLEPAGDDDETVSEIAFIDNASDSAGSYDRDRTTVKLVGPLAHVIERATVRINANIAAATHGETVQEVLGSGDASQPDQKFTLRQPPLTYVSAANAGGAQSTLEVRVDDLLWHEAPTLYDHGFKDHVYVSRHSNDSKTMIEFGDGITGARLPSGQNNVRAVYRKGIGLDGLVKSGQLSMLLSRPLGVKSVVNPLEAAGADNPEQLADARRNAPLTALTLDRIVSPRDYEDFATAFAGIAKALATWTWDGNGRSVFLTVAGPNGAQVRSDSTTYEHLLAAMQNAGDPFVRVRVESYRPTSFRIAANIKIKPDFAAEKVLPSVEETLRTRFAFAARAFAQPVMLSEVIAVVQAVPGVMAVDVDKLYRSDATSATLEQRLLADLPVTLSDGQLVGAELLMLDPAPLEYLGVMQ